jgi:tRNA (guanine37-N1)-methyltransferase
VVNIRDFGYLCEPSPYAPSGASDDTPTPISASCGEATRSRRRRVVDDTPYGGGAGMVMRPDVIAAAIDSVAGVEKLYYMSPRGQVMTQKKTQDIQSYEHIGILCGRYEGIDQRVIDHYGIEELSIGDFVLSGGELAAFCIIDACIRQRNGVVGNALTLAEESFSDGKYAYLLEYPLYTRPAEWRGTAVPEILVSGNHQAIDGWRFEQAEAVTRERRNDLWRKHKNEVTS